MAKIMYAWTARCRTWHQAGDLGEPVESLVHVLVDQPGSVAGDEPCPGRRRWAPLVTERGVLGQGRHGGRVQREFSGLAELAVANHEHLVGEIYLVAVEVDGLPDPHPRHGQQPDQRAVGRRD